MNEEPQPFTRRLLHHFRVVKSLVLLSACWLGLAPEILADPPEDAASPTSQVPSASTTSTNDRHVQRIREGTQIVNQLGTFKPAGDRFVFLSATDKGRFLCLENLNLERVARLVRDNPENLQWEISGTVTEYGGANYLEISRATLRSKTRGRKDGN